MGKVKKTQEIYTVKTLFAELAEIRKIFKRKQKGYRFEIYHTLQLSQKMIVKLESKDELKRAFCRHIASKRKNRRASDFGATNLSTEVVALATGARSRNARKVAWKRARVLDYLRERDVDVSKTAEKIKAMGGIEKILAMASKKSDDSRKSKKLPPPQKNDRKIQVPVWMKLSDRDAIAEQSVGTKFKLFALRVGQRQGDLSITKIKQMGEKKTAEIAVEADWSDS